jgi:hypothetical protein
LATSWAGAVTFGVTDCGVSIAVRVSGECVTMDTAGSVEGAVAIGGATTPGVSSEVRVDCVLTTTSLSAPLPLVVRVGDESDGRASINLDDNRFLVGCGVVDADPLVPDADGGVGVEARRCAPRMPVNVLRPVRELPSSVDVLAPGDVGAALDSDGVEVLVRPKPPLGVFAEVEPDAPLSCEPLADDPEESWESGPAHAIPLPVNSAAPTPNATASPPTRPIYLEAFTDSPDSAHGCSWMLLSRKLFCGIAGPVSWSDPSPATRRRRIRGRRGCARGPDRISRANAGGGSCRRAAAPPAPALPPRRPRWARSR